MKKIPFEQACELFENHPVCRGGITPYKLIVNGIVTFEEWKAVLERNTNPEYDDLRPFDDTKFSKKLYAFLKPLGWTEFYFAPKFRRRSKNTGIESVKLLNTKINVSREY